MKSVSVVRIFNSQKALAQYAEYKRHLRKIH